ncbi:MAG: glutaredoxin 3 [Candidatus Omnitrophica bacterium]|nr:glutaredoxin 3 [Candidatus Omnitrophota bacterium]
MESAKVKVYAASYCPYCKAAKELLKEKGVAFEEVDITDDTAMREKLVKMTGGRTTVPQIFSGEKLIGGYDDLKAFYAAGHAL